jgi:peptidoglycan hydrolase FlgJ
MQINSSLLVGPAGSTQSGAADKAREASMMQAAQAFEANFLAQFLKESGLGKTPESLGGGEGEDAFASYMAEERARQMVEAGGIGLARHVFDAMKRMEAK